MKWEAPQDQRLDFRIRKGFSHRGLRTTRRFDITGVDGSRYIKILLRSVFVSMSFATSVWDFKSSCFSYDLNVLIAEHEGQLIPVARTSFAGSQTLRTFGFD